MSHASLEAALRKYRTKIERGSDHQAGQIVRTLQVIHLGHKNEYEPGGRKHLPALWKALGGKISRRDLSHSKTRRDAWVRGRLVRESRDGRVQVRYSAKDQTTSRFGDTGTFWLLFDGQVVEGYETEQRSKGLRYMLGALRAYEKSASRHPRGEVHEWIELHEARVKRKIGKGR